MNASLNKKATRARWLAGFLVLAVALAFGAQALAGSSAKGRLVKADGHRLYLRCAGTGYPVVMLEAGLGDWSKGWKAVLARSAQVGSTVCAYDRFGLGQSGTYTSVRSIASVVSDLHSLVRNAKLRGPYVFAGSSIGGIVTRSYARLYPAQVAGMVFFDSVPDDWDQYLGIPVFDGGGEKLDITAATARLRASDKLGKKPLVVLQAGDESYLEQVTQRSDLLDYWNPSQQKLARLSKNSLFALVTGQPHWIQSAAPKLSAEAIRLVVAAVRNKQPLPTCVKSKLPKLGAACK
jgi:hypothetical protein